MRRSNLERAILDAGYATTGEFADAIGFSALTLRRWLRCAENPGRDARRAIASALELSPGADCEEVAEADLDWLLEPCDASRT